MQGGTEHVARFVASTSQLAVGVAVLDDEAAQIERVLHEFACLLNGHALLLAELEEQLCVFLLAGMVFGVDDSGLADIAKAPLHSLLSNLCGITDEDEVGHFVRQDLVGSLEGALLRSFGQYDALAVGLSARNKLFYEFHCNKCICLCVAKLQLPLDTWGFFLGKIWPRGLNLPYMFLSLLGESIYIDVMYGRK